MSKVGRLFVFAPGVLSPALIPDDVLRITGVLTPEVLDTIKRKLSHGGSVVYPSAGDVSVLLHEHGIPFELIYLDTQKVSLQDMEDFGMSWMTLAYYSVNYNHVTQIFANQKDCVHHLIPNLQTFSLEQVLNSPISQ